MWLTFVTMTTVGYGDLVPSTHGGRLAMAFASVTGILLASLITAAITNLIVLTPQEQSASSTIEREQARLNLRKTASMLIIAWWKKRKGKTLSRAQSKLDKFVLRREFLELKLDTMQEISDLASMDSKLDKVTKSVKDIEAQLERIAEYLWTHDEVIEMQQVSQEAVGRMGVSLSDPIRHVRLTNNVVATPTLARVRACARAHTDEGKRKRGGRGGKEGEAKKNKGGREGEGKNTNTHIAQMPFRHCRLTDKALVTELGYDSQTAARCHAW